ncbi:MAG: hypothetical protein ACYTG6_01095, partial [Planctomycetota bacterium]
VWQDDTEVAAEVGAVLDINDFLQAPVRIVKVLVYEDGKLVAPEDEPSEHKAEVEETETSLATIEVDRYLVPMPERPGSDEGDGGDEEEDPGDEGEAGDAGTGETDEPGEEGNDGDEEEGTDDATGDAAGDGDDDGSEGGN